MNTTVPGADGTIGPGPGQYGRPHVYARDITSGAGNCVCGHPLTDQRHTETAPGVPRPDTIAGEYADLAARLTALSPPDADPADPGTYAFPDDDDAEANLEREYRIRNIVHDAMVVRAGQLWRDAQDATARDAVVAMLATYIEYALARPAGLNDPAAAALKTANSFIRMESDGTH